MAEEKPTLLESILRQVPDTWGAGRCGILHLSLLEGYSQEYQAVCRDFMVTLRVKPLRIERVENAFLLGMYQLKKAEYIATVPQTRELNLWHATSERNFKNIMQTSLDWRLATRIKFGQGVSFSSSAKYADDQCNRANPSARVSIRCKVLVGQSQPGSSFTRVPANGVDTTMGNGTMVYVKFADYESYPEYAVHYVAP